MGEVQHSFIRSTGFTTLYEPLNEQPIADIVLVHGLQGSPRGTWSYSTPDATHDHCEDGTDTKSRRKSLMSLLSGLGRSRKSISSDAEIERIDSKASGASKGQRVHWPADLLPGDCPAARILVWGYDSKVTKGYTAANKSNLFSHAKDLLYALDRERNLGRNLIFVTHSLGGLIVKEVLRRSQHSEDPGLKNIIQSTKSVVFLGTPHRGSAGYAGYGELARKVASRVLRVDSNAAIIRALGLDSPELELSRESFIEQWRIYNFQVKTFQESLAPSGMNFGNANEKIVPDMSSSLEDPRERAETLQGDHRNMTKFSSPDDPNYIKVAGELKRILGLLSHNPSTYQETTTLSTQVQTANVPPEPKDFSRQEEDCLRTLSFTAMLSRQQNIREAMNNTCGWFYASIEYNTWYTREKVNVDHGLLWVKGKPGAGKSTVMKNAVHRMEAKERPFATVAAFYFNARGSVLERTPLGLFRSILHQICCQDRKILAEFLKTYIERQKSAFSADDFSWSRIELENFIRKIFSKLKPQQTFIFIDALDECDENTVREIVHLFAELGKSAFDAGLDLRICLSSRHYPTISIPHCPEIMVEGANTPDIATYIREKFKFIAPGEEENIKELETDIIEKASGVFLWAVLVVDLLLQDIDTGQPVDVITKRLKNVPKRMEDLYAKLCESLKPEEKAFSLGLLQWVLLTTPMDIGDVFLGALFSTIEQNDLPVTLARWGFEEGQAPPTDRLVRYLKNSSRGLLEFRSDRVQFIHETVREFFLTGPGFSMLDPTLATSHLALSQKVIMMASMAVLEFPYDWECLNYLRGYCKEHLLVAARAAEEAGVSTVVILDRLHQLNSKLWAALSKQRGESRLHYLARQRLTSCVVDALARGYDPDDTSSGSAYSTPLMAAVSRGIPHIRPEIMVQSLINYGADLTRRDENANTPFLRALDSDEPALADLIRVGGAAIDVTNFSGECALHIILHLKAKVSSSAEAEKIPDSHAEVARVRYERLFDTLLDENIPLEAKAWTDSTPLHYAAFIGDVRAVEKLVQHGANVHATSELGNPLFSAANCPSAAAAQICDILLLEGADPHMRDNKDRTVLHHAARCSTPKTVEMLVKAGVDVNAIDTNGQNACHRAVERSSVSAEIISILVEAGCSVMAKDRTGRTPLQTLWDYQSMTSIDDKITEMLKGDQQVRRAPTWEQWTKPAQTRI